MLDLKFVRENAEVVKEAVKNKKANVDVDELLGLDKERRAIMIEQEGLKAQQNKASLKAPTAQEIEELKLLKNKIKELSERLNDVDARFNDLASKLPNIPSPDTPIGLDESANKVIKQVGEIPVFDFKPKEHWELGEALDVLDIERAAKVSGTRFVYLKGALVLMQYALIQFAYSILTDEKKLAAIIKKTGLNIKSKPFVPIIPPVIVKPQSLSRMGRLEPKDERYYIQSDDAYLVGSAEHALGPMHMDEAFKEEDLPIRYAGFSTAFRREAGSYGKDTKGMLRVHQFDKLELESFTGSDGGLAEQDFFVAIQEHIVSELKMPYQVMAICTGDMGGPDYRQIDIEIWMPGQNRYRETHTADYMTDFQSRRLNIKVKKEDGSEFVHMNDATCIAIGRTLIAIMENYQTKEGTIKVPKVLQPFMAGLREIK